MKVNIPHLIFTLCLIIAYIFVIAWFVSRSQAEATKDKNYTTLPSQHELDSIEFSNTPYEFKN